MYIYTYIYITHMNHQQDMVTQKNTAKNTRIDRRHRLRSSRPGEVLTLQRCFRLCFRQRPATPWPGAFAEQSHLVMSKRVGIAPNSYHDAPRLVTYRSRETEWSSEIMMVSINGGIHYGLLFPLSDTWGVS